MLVGTNNSHSLRKLSDNHVIAFVLPCMLIPTIFMSVSHTGYVDAAWLVEPHKGSFTLLVVYLLVTYFYLVFKKCYRLHSKVVLSAYPKITSEDAVEESSDHHELDTFLPLVTDSSSTEQVRAGPESEDKTKDYDGSVVENKKDKAGSKHTTFKLCRNFYIHYGVESEYINVQMFCLTLDYGFLFAVFAGLALSVFVLVPAASESIVT